MDSSINSRTGETRQALASNGCFTSSRAWRAVDGFRIAKDGLHHSSIVSQAAWVVRNVRSSLRMSFFA
jgi:hypothetical protein